MKAIHQKETGMTNPRSVLRTKKEGKMVVTSEAQASSVVISEDTSIVPSEDVSQALSDDTTITLQPSAPATATPLQLSVADTMVISQ